jgi:MAC/Perforin domain
MNVPELQLQQLFVNEIHSRLKQLLGNLPVGWKNFIATFGTHYVHAMTLGSVKCALTRFSLASEVKAHTSGFDLKAKATAALSAAKKSASKVGGVFDFKNELKQELGLTTESEEVTSYNLGAESQPVAIFYDLRPITELFNPIFFLYNPADDWEKYSPFVWHGLRDSLETYLKSLGLNQPIEQSASDDFMPRVVKLTIPSANAYIDNRYHPELQQGLFVTGDIQFLQAQDHPTTDTPYVLKKGYRHFQDERVDGSNYKDSEVFYCLIATRRGQLAQVKMSYNLDIAMGDVGYHQPAGCVFKGEGVVAETTTRVPNEVNKEYVSIYFNMHFNLKWEEVPWGPKL